MCEPLIAFHDIALLQSTSVLYPTKESKSSNDGVQAQILLSISFLTKLYQVGKRSSSDKRTSHNALVLRQHPSDMLTQRDYGIFNCSVLYTNLSVASFSRELYGPRVGPSSLPLYIFNHARNIFPQ